MIGNPIQFVFVLETDNVARTDEPYITYLVKIYSALILNNLENMPIKDLMSLWEAKEIIINKQL